MKIRGVNSRRGWHLAALAVFALAAATHAHAWFTADRMPPGDFPGYAAQVQYVRDALLEHGRVPFWCGECYGGTTNFTASLKEVLAFPLALAFDPVLATKLAFVLLRVAAAFGLYALVARELAAPAVGDRRGLCATRGARSRTTRSSTSTWRVATALLPSLWIAAVGSGARGGARSAIALGVAMACQLANNWVHAATAPLAVLATRAASRPWHGRTSARRGATRARAALALRGLAAFAVFCAFAASPVAWLASDARNHRLLPARRHRAAALGATSSARRSCSRTATTRSRPGSTRTSRATAWRSRTAGGATSAPSRSR